MRLFRYSLAGLLALTMVGACTQVLGIDGDYSGLDDDGAGGTSSGTATGTSSGTATGTGTGTESGTTTGTPSGTTGKADGEPCANGSECQSGACVDDRCCGMGCGGPCEGCAEAITGEPDGTCAPVPDGTRSICPGNQACYGGTCSLRPNGEPCTANGQCQATCGSEDVCCNTNCGGDCESCLAANTGEAEGTCSPITAGTDPKMACPMNQTCDGMGSCM